jgi:hypothetical protein
MLNNIQKLLLAIATLALFSSIMVAQKNPNITRRWGIPKKPQNSEMNAADMEQVRALMQEEPNPDGVIILVARLGKGETRRELNRRRLFNVSERYTAALSIPAEKVIAAEGERVNDFGRVEIYWNGELIGALPVFKNRDLHVDCCGPDERYYPDKDATERRNKRKLKRRRRV